MLLCLGGGNQGFLREEHQYIKGIFKTKYLSLLAVNIINKEMKDYFNIQIDYKIWKIDS